jgi:hypothetical protein
MTEARAKTEFLYSGSRHWGRHCSFSLKPWSWRLRDAVLFGKCSFCLESMPVQEVFNDYAFTCRIIDSIYIGGRRLVIMSLSSSSCFQGWWDAHMHVLTKSIVDLFVSTPPHPNHNLIRGSIGSVSLWKIFFLLKQRSTKWGRTLSW